jgi:hypothetical protein
MDQLILVLILLVIILLLILVIVMSYFGYKILKTKEKTSLAEKEFHPEVRKRLDEAKVLAKKLEHSASFCPHHPEEPAEAMCNICDTYFCEKCIKNHKTLLFCREHYQLYMNNDWNKIIIIKSTPSEPELGVRLYDFKRKLYKDNLIPTVVETHYKINIDHDNIESYLVLFAQKNHTEKIQLMLKDDNIIESKESFS